MTDPATVTPEQHADTVSDKTAIAVPISLAMAVKGNPEAYSDLAALAKRADTLERDLAALNAMLLWRIERYKQARAEADRLREALREIEALLPVGYQAKAIARAALAGPTESAGQASPGPQTKEQT